MHDNLSMILILLERISIVAVIAYVFSQTRAFRFMFKEEMSLREKGILTVFFSSVSIAGTYLGIPVENALVNVRDTGVIVAGLLGGPAVGIVTGLIGGLHRISLGGFTAVSCGVSTIFAGILSGYVHVKMKPKTPECVTGIIIGIAVVLLSLGFVAIFGEPRQAARSLVHQAILPMCLANGLGISVFMIIIQNALDHQTKIGALQTHKALRIANAALPYFRQGLNIHSAQKVADTIMGMTTASAISITNHEQVLAYIGLADDHHIVGRPIMTSITKAVLQTGHLIVAQNAKEIGCEHENCPLKSAVIVPLFCKDKIVGTLKLYYNREDAMNALDIEFAQGLGQIFSTQLELANLQQVAELATKAELKALRAQINPHFLFNALNTIVSLCRINPEEARRLIIELGEFFRRSLKAARDFVTLQEEIEFVDSYLSLEKARFGSRLTIQKDIAVEALKVQVPAFTLQPLVENAVKHGLLAKKEGGTVKIIANICGDELAVIIEDDGKGISDEVLSHIFEHGYGVGVGVGLSNVNDRLLNLYGPQYALCIDSHVGQGTVVKMSVPLAKEGVVA